MTQRSVTRLLGFAVASLSGVVPTPLFADQGSEINSTLTTPMRTLKLCAVRDGRLVKMAMFPG